MSWFWPVSPPSAGSPGISGAASNTEVTVSRAAVVNSVNMSTLYILMTWRWDGPLWMRAHWISEINLLSYYGKRRTLLHWCASKMRRLVKCVALSSTVAAHPPGLLKRDTHTDTVQSGRSSPPATSRRGVTFGAVFGVGVSIVKVAGPSASEALVTPAPVQTY